MALDVKKASWNVSVKYPVNEWLVPKAQQTLCFFCLRPPPPRSVYEMLGSTSRLFGSQILVFHFPGMIERVKCGVPYQVPQRPLAGQFTL